MRWCLPLTTRFPTLIVSGWQECMYLANGKDISMSQFQMIQMIPRLLYQFVALAISVLLLNQMSLFIKLKTIFNSYVTVSDSTIIHSLWDAPAGNHGRKKIPVVDAVYNYHDSLQVHLINGISHSSSLWFVMRCSKQATVSKQMLQDWNDILFTSL